MIFLTFGIPGVKFFEPADQLAAGTAVVFQLTPDVMDIAIAQDITVQQIVETYAGTRR